jgi:hypothetical protein
MVSPASAFWRRLLIVAAVGQLVSPTLIFLSSNDALTSEATATAITPPGWAFAMWGVICTASLVYAIYQRPTGRPNSLEALFDRLAPPLSVVFTLYTLWLVLAELEWVWGTVLVFTAMLVGLLRAGQVAAGDPQLARVSTGPRLLVSVLLGTYAGWNSIALFVNLSAAIRQSGAPIDTPTGLIWQALLLTGAVGVGAVVTIRWGASIPYVLTVLWALAGAATSTYQQQALSLTAICGVGIATILLVSALSWRGTLGHRPTLRATTSI